MCGHYERPFSCFSAIMKGFLVFLFVLMIYYCYLVYICLNFYFSFVLRVSQRVLQFCHVLSSVFFWGGGGLTKGSSQACLKMCCDWGC